MSSIAFQMSSYGLILDKEYTVLFPFDMERDLEVSTFGSLHEKVSAPKRVFTGLGDFNTRSTEVQLDRSEYTGDVSFCDDDRKMFSARFKLGILQSVGKI